MKSQLGIPLPTYADDRRVYKFADVAFFGHALVPLTPPSMPYICYHSVFWHKKASADAFFHGTQIENCSLTSYSFWKLLQFTKGIVLKVYQYK